MRAHDFCGTFFELGNFVHVCILHIGGHIYMYLIVEEITLSRRYSLLGNEQTNNSASYSFIFLHRAWRRLLHSDLLMVGDD